MQYKDLSPAQERIFKEDGYVVLEDAIPERALQVLQNCCQRIITQSDQYNIFDWARSAKVQAIADYKILQVSAYLHFPTLRESDLYQWIAAQASELMGQEMVHWFDQFLLKPPENQAATPWHQDEAYWGKTLYDQCITCWIPLQAVDNHNGCMVFLPKGHIAPVRPHRRTHYLYSDLLECDVDVSQACAIPMALGSVSFHHGRTPHMTGVNHSKSWRFALSLHLKGRGVKGDGQHYPWRIFVDQRSGREKTASQDEDNSDYFF